MAFDRYPMSDLDQTVKVGGLPVYGEALAPALPKGGPRLPATDQRYCRCLGKRLATLGGSAESVRRAVLADPWATRRLA